MKTHLLNWTGVMASAVLTLLVYGVYNTEAAPILDQSFEPPSTNLLLGSSPGSFGAQTFTVGITGILTQVDALVERNGLADLRFDVRPTINGVPIEDDHMVLASLTGPASTVPFPAAFLSFDVSSFGIPVSQGDVLAIVLTGNSRWFGVPDNLYPGGAAYFRRFPDIPTFAPAAGIMDLGFRTFVDPSIAPIPEPSTMLLLGSGVVGLIGFRRKLKK